MLTQILLIVLGVLAMGFFALLATYWLWFPAMLRFFADRNFLITAIEEGYAKAFMKFGEFNRLAMSWRGHYFDINWNVVEGTPAQGTPHAPEEHWIDKHLPGGLRWIGLPFANTIYRYHFQWTSVRQGTLGAGVQTEHGLQSIVEQKNLEDLLISRDERPDRILLKRDAYVVNFQNIDDKEMIPLSFIALLTGRVVNPYLAYLKQEQWLEQTINFLRGYIKEYVGENTFEQLVTTSPGKTTYDESISILERKVVLSGDAVGEHIKKQWGFEIEQINLVNFQTAGKRGEAYEASAAKKYQAERERESIVVLADAESQRITKVAEGEARAIEIRAGAEAKRVEILAAAEKQRLITVADGEAERITKVAGAVQAGGESAMTIRSLEALETMGAEGNTIVIGGDKPPQMLINSTRPERKNP